LENIYFGQDWTLIKNALFRRAVKNIKAGKIPTDMTNIYWLLQSNYFHYRVQNLLTTEKIGQTKDDEK